MKNRTQEISLWLKMSLYKEKKKFKSLTLIYIMTLGALWIFEGFLENVNQFEWFGTSTNSSSSLFKKLGMEHINDYGSSWMNIISNSLCTSKIVLVSKLFLQIFCENILISFIIMLVYCL